MPHALPPVTLSRTGAVTAAGVGVEALWRALLTAEPLARTVERYRTDDLTVRRAALVDDALWRGFEAGVAARGALREGVDAEEEARAGVAAPFEVPAGGHEEGSRARAPTPAPRANASTIGSQVRGAALTAGGVYPISAPPLTAR